MDLTSTVGSSGSNASTYGMDVLGYDVVDCDGRPPEELINAVISAGKAIYDLAPSDQVFSISIGGNIECDKFLSHGVNVSFAPHYCE